MTSVVSLLRSTSLADTAYAYAASVSAGSRLLFMAGACPLRPDGSTAGPGDHAEQARVCLDNLQQALADAGAGLADVVSTRILVVATRRENLVSTWEVVSERLGGHDVPSTLVGVNLARLPRPARRDRSGGCGHRLTPTEQGDGTRR